MPVGSSVSCSCFQRMVAQGRIPCPPRPVLIPVPHNGGRVFLSRFLSRVSFGLYYDVHRLDFSGRRVLRTRADRLRGSPHASSPPNSPSGLDIFFIYCQFCPHRLRRISILWTCSWYEVDSELAQTRVRDPPDLFSANIPGSTRSFLLLSPSSFFRNLWVKEPSRTFPAAKDGEDLPLSPPMIPTSSMNGAQKASPG